MEKTKKKNEWLEWGKAILIAIILALFLRTFIFATSIVDGESMEPTLEDGETVLFNKFTYLFEEPEREDIVIIKRPLKNYVKRVIGLPGETISVKNKTLYIDGEAYNQSFLNNERLKMTGHVGPVKVPKDNYFVMGDNRAISKDSRNGLGFIRESEIIGKSELIIFPFKEWSTTR
ncbi:signal peptidase I [Lentibacillus cibarius]|uniref:Signal peptidase I n=1 Tax=Lentibacillus cibarius TaxID=2583219 RepID=A0A549YK53_9BACI|nr:signal peptidase I [Lentibacillus cibarius]TRM12234.1 signal peptidase I [Lentibacillus cibarius]